MPIESLGNNGWVATGNSIGLVRLLAIRGRLQLEIQGIRFKGAATSNAARQILGTTERSRSRLVHMLTQLIEQEKNK